MKTIISYYIFFIVEGLQILCYEKNIAISSILLLISFDNLKAQDWQYLGQKLPQNEAILFAPEILASAFNERDLAISPDGKEIYYSIITSEKTAVIVFCKYEKGEWQMPKIASFSGSYQDIEPVFSLDGKRLYFVSNRNLNGEGIKDFDIWFVEKDAKGNWQSPQNLGAPINTSANEFYPSLTQDGSLYFTAKYESGIGGEDIWLSKFADGKFNKPEVLSSSVNSTQDEFNAFVAPDGKYILFSSYGRSDDMGRGDLYISQKNAQGEWEMAKNLKSLNSPRLDYCPYVSPDGKYFFFTSERIVKTNVANNPFKINDLLNRFMQAQNGRGDIYWIKTSEIFK